MKRGFSRMLWGGVILLVVLFFVGVYGVKEGFVCKEGNDYLPATIQGKKLTGCYSFDCVKSNITNPTDKQDANCYFGIAATKTSGGSMTSSTPSSTPEPALPNIAGYTYSGSDKKWNMLR